jgi:bacterioferritin-associated ferredoxin
MQTLACLQEPVLFEDVLCQLHDMLQPGREGCYTLADVRRTRPQSSLLFNTLFNLQKFMAYENRCGCCATASDELMLSSRVTAASDTAMLGTIAGDKFAIICCARLDSSCTLTHHAH